MNAIDNFLHLLILAVAEKLMKELNAAPQDEKCSVQCIQISEERK